LLEAEARAQDIIDAASMPTASVFWMRRWPSAREAEARFESGRADLRAPFLKEAHGRADQAIAELSRKYDERQRATTRDGDTT
jgi:hypothetical protein